MPPRVGGGRCVSLAQGADQDRGRCTESVGSRKENELKAEEMRLEDAGGECEGAAGNCNGHHNSKRSVKLACSGFRLCSWVRNYPVDQKEKCPLAEVKDLFEPMTRTAQVTPIQQHGRRKIEPQATSKPPLPCVISFPWKHPLHAPFQ